MINCCKTLVILVVLWYNSIVNEWYTFTTNTSTKGQQKKMKVSKENAGITWVTRDDGIDE